MGSIKSRLEHCVTPNALRSYLAEFISTFLYVFAAVGSVISSRKLTASSVAAASEPSSLLGIAVANAFALSVAVYVSANISGGHVNPAVTFGMAVGGHISIPMSIIYWISQMLGSAIACLVLKIATAGQHIPTHGIATQMTGFGASFLEGVTTFILVYTVYAASDKKHGSLGIIGPLAIGLVSGANILASGPFSGGSMNPAHSFGSAIVEGTFRNQAVYWVGPLIGAAFAGLLYENVVSPARAAASQETLSPIGADGRVTVQLKQLASVLSFNFA